MTEFRSLNTPEKSLVRASSCFPDKLSVLHGTRLPIDHPVETRRKGHLEYHFDSDQEEVIQPTCLSFLICFDGVGRSTYL